MRRKSFFLIEILIGIGLILTVTMSIFSLELKMTQALNRAARQLQMETAFNNAVTLLVEKLTGKEIPFASMGKPKPVEVDLGYLDWRASYTFSIRKSTPASTPNIFLIETAIEVFHPDEELVSKKGSFSFCLSTNPMQANKT